AKLSNAINNLRESYFTKDFRITPQDPEKEIVPVSYAVCYVKIPHKRNLEPRYRGPALILQVRDCVVTVQHLDGTIQRVNDKHIKPAHGWKAEDFEAAKQGIYPNSLPSDPDNHNDLWSDLEIKSLGRTKPLRMAMSDFVQPALEDPELILPKRPANTLPEYGSVVRSRDVSIASVFESDSELSDDPPIPQPPPPKRRAVPAELPAERPRLPRQAKPTSAKLVDPLLRGRIRRPPANLLIYSCFMITSEKPENKSLHENEEDDLFNFELDSELGDENIDSLCSFVLFNDLACDSISGTMDNPNAEKKSQPSLLPPTPSPVPREPLNVEALFQTPKVGDMETSPIAPNQGALSHSAGSAACVSETRTDSSAPTSVQNQQAALRHNSFAISSMMNAIRHWRILHMRGQFSLELIFNDDICKGKIVRGKSCDNHSAFYIPMALANDCPDNRAPDWTPDMLNEAQRMPRDAVQTAETDAQANLDAPVVLASARCPNKVNFLCLND
ncbi:MAG TPA: hypothetical protein VK861_10510, partial [Bacteroidales bacterium]|nr:hypothetical protein [Bacteroidales bacterium]